MRRGTMCEAVSVRCAPKVRSVSFPHCKSFFVSLLTTMADSNVTLSTATMLHAKVDSLEIGPSLPDARYQKNKKKIEISVDDKVEWSYKWTKTFAPPLGKDLYVWHSYCDRHN
ncbi:hypothetical protein BDN67DRAFT_427862 [Paxillus ammoniavirescens]|nr:hypothetical protein BDN67DRAFT_427862 [Paxillus ammoniavirescens]